jgi:hypothetical protein
MREAADAGRQALGFEFHVGFPLLAGFSLVVNDMRGLFKGSE